MGEYPFGFSPASSPALGSLLPAGRLVGRSRAWFGARPAVVASVLHPAGQGRKLAATGNEQSGRAAPEPGVRGLLAHEYWTRSIALSP